MSIIAARSIREWIGGRGTGARKVATHLCDSRKEGKTIPYQSAKKKWRHCTSLQSTVR